jgi:hypothetical protein
MSSNKNNQDFFKNITRKKVERIKLIEGVSRIKEINEFSG